MTVPEQGADTDSARPEVMPELVERLAGDRPIAEDKLGLIDIDVACGLVVDFRPDARWLTDEIGDCAGYGQQPRAIVGFSSTGRMVTPRVRRNTGVCSFSPTSRTRRPAISGLST